MILSLEKRRQRDPGLRVKVGINLKIRPKTWGFKTNKYKRNSHLKAEGQFSETLCQEQTVKGEVERERAWK